MLSKLGIDAVTEAVYRCMLEHPQKDVPEWAAGLGLSEDEVRRALHRLSELALVRVSAEDTSTVRPVNPILGLEALVARQQAELAAQTQQVEASRAAVAELLAEYSHRHSPTSKVGMQYLAGIDEIRDQLEAINSEVREEFLTFAPGGPQSPENMRASRPLNQRLLDRDITMRTIYLSSIRRDAATVAHAEWLESLGAQIRTVPTLPNRIIICDRRIALIAANTENTADGAVVVTSPGMIALLCALFDHVWQTAEPLGASPRRSPGSLDKQQLEVLRLMAQGRTDESIANSLGVSTRTVRRIANGLLTHLNARSRFQAAVHAVRQGYLSASPE
ncbi:helix-turn-helix transcriptional regulator [Streptomyces sp. NPDC044571]|uniref:helix-turn-helix transcriptional regulator n=1 Tax=Streptomyces sp. NPDC044571 TaxID=3155371 RepID=UPI0034073E17